MRERMDWAQYATPFIGRRPKRRPEPRREGNRRVFVASNGRDCHSVAAECRPGCVCRFCTRRAAAETPDG